MKIVVEWSELKKLGVVEGTAVSIAVGGLSFQDVLNSICQQMSPTQQKQVSFLADNGVITISTQAKLDIALVTVPYDVSDLTHSNQAELAALCDQIQKTIAPASWKSAGGAGNIKVSRYQLTVTQSRRVQSALAAMLTNLRSTRVEAGANK